MTANALIWLLIAAVSAADCALLGELTMGLETHRIARVLLGVGGLSIAACLYRHRSPPLARVANFGAQLVAANYAFNVLTYTVTAVSPFPLADAVFSHADAALGFDWASWFRLVDSHAGLRRILQAAYGSIPVQAIVLIGYFSIKNPRRLHEMLLATIWSLTVISAIMILLPADGSSSYGKVGIVVPWMQDVTALRAGAVTTIGHTEGIAAFPSFHTVLAVLLATMARDSLWFRPILVLNILMIVSVISEGGHYLVDVISGFALAFVALAVARLSLARCTDPASGSVVNGQATDENLVTAPN